MYRVAVFRRRLERCNVRNNHHGDTTKMKQTRGGKGGEERGSKREGRVEGGKEEVWKKGCKVTDEVWKG